MRRKYSWTRARPANEVKPGALKRRRTEPLTRRARSALLKRIVDGLSLKVCVASSKLHTSQRKAIFKYILSPTSFSYVTSGLGVPREPPRARRAAHASSDA